MLAGGWWSMPTSLSFSIYANLPPSCRIHVVSQLLLEVFFYTLRIVISLSYTQCWLPFLPSSQGESSLLSIGKSRASNGEAAAATALSLAESITERASIFPPKLIVQASKHGHTAVWFIIYTNCPRRGGSEQVPSNTLSPFWYIILFGTVQTHALPQSFP